jgi:hypothetical protein
MAGKADLTPSSVRHATIVAPLVAPAPRQRLRRIGLAMLAAAAGLVLLLAATRLWLIDGWLRTVRIEGASMAPALCGKHWLVTCTDCRLAFRCDAESPPASGKFVCPNCGFRELSEKDGVLESGDRVLLDRWPVLWSLPKRGAVVAAENPLSPGLTVKRVAAVAGQRPAIRGGDLYADGIIVRKSLAEFRELAVLVHDNDFLPASAAKETSFVRWRPAATGSRWRPVPGGFRWQPAADPAGGEPDWLEYVHWRCDASNTPRQAPAPILDNDSYNQGLPRRLNQVRDVVFQCRVRLDEECRLRLEVLTFGTRLSTEIDAMQQTATLAVEERIVHVARGLALRAGAETRLEFGTFDRQLVLAIAGRTVAAAVLERDAGGAGGSRPPLRVAASGGTAEITQLRVWRDQYLLEPHGTQADWEAAVPLAEDEVFLLGDNSPASIDGRHWQPLGTKRGKLRGIVRGLRRP